MDNFIPAARVGIYIMKYDYKIKMLNNPNCAWDDPHFALRVYANVCIRTRHAAGLHTYKPLCYVYKELPILFYYTNGITVTNIK